MENLKIRVNNKAESKEVMSLLDMAGYTKGIIDNMSKPCWIAVLDGKQYSDYMLSKSIWYTANPKEVTLPELRAMVNPMKEYLEKQPDGTYALVLRGDLCKESDILIPEGAEALTKEIVDSEEMLLWWRDNFNKCIGHDDQLSNHEIDVYNHLERNPKPVILWQREQDEPFLTPECTLNDQYAEIERVRQVEIHGIAKAKPDLNFGAAQASGGAKMRENNHYFIDVSDVDEVDFYEIAKRYNVTDPAVQHILKKCLAIGNRGHKDLETDLKDIFKTAKRALQINGFGE